MNRFHYFFIIISTMMWRSINLDRILMKYNDCSNKYNSKSEACIIYVNSYVNRTKFNIIN